MNFYILSFRTLNMKTLFNSFYEASITLIPKSDKKTKAEKYRLVSFMCINEGICNKV